MLMQYKEQITFLFAFVAFILSLYNFRKDSRKVKLTYRFFQSEHGGYELVGFLSNPSKNPNSIISYSFFKDGVPIETAKHDGKGYNLKKCYVPSKISPIESTTVLANGSSIIFGSYLFTDLNSNDKIKMELITANYKKTFKIKIKDEF